MIETGEGREDAPFSSVDAERDSAHLNDSHKDTELKEIVWQLKETSLLFFVQST
jgi:hypothetical protein